MRYPTRKTRDQRDRFMSFVSPEPMSGCWVWMGKLSNKGYGQFWRFGETIGAHRAGYELFRGSIPEGLFIDHLCKSVWCCNPWHMEPVTPRENMRRSDIGQREWAKTQCPQGHPYDGDNLRVSRGSRQCKACSRQRMRARYYRNRGRALPSKIMSKKEQPRVGTRWVLPGEQEASTV